MLALDLDEPMRLSRPPAVQGLGKWRTLVDGEAHFGKAAVAKGRAEDGLGPPPGREAATIVGVGLGAGLGHLGTPSKAIMANESVKRAQNCQSNVSATWTKSKSRNLKLDCDVIRY